MSSQKTIEEIGELVRAASPNLAFTLFEIGAVPIEGHEEPFHKLLEIFPESQLIAFEVDEKLCDELNEKSGENVSVFPIALGEKCEQRDFYETNHPMCCSLYRPNEPLLSLYNALDVAMLESVTKIDTMSLDEFVRQHEIDAIDFIKIDVQGAELDVFMGGMNDLHQTVAIVSEVEFIPLYVDQPLFGDVCKSLAKMDLMFHKFLGVSGRTLKPVVLDGNICAATQHMWSDAVFLRDIKYLDGMPADSLLKMGVLAYLYGSPDVTFHCFKKHDDVNGTSLHQNLFSA